MKAPNPGRQATRPLKLLLRRNTSTFSQRPAFRYSWHDHAIKASRSGAGLRVRDLRGAFAEVHWQPIAPVQQIAAALHATRDAGRSGNQKRQRAIHWTRQRLKTDRLV